MSRLSLPILSLGTLLAIFGFAPDAAAQKGRALVPYHSRTAQGWRQQAKLQPRANAKPTGRAFKTVMREFRAKMVARDIVGAEKLLHEMKGASGKGMLGNAQIRRSGRKLRKLAGRMAREGLNNGSAAQDAAIREERLAKVNDIKSRVKAMKAYGKLTHEQRQAIRQELRQLQQELPALRHGSSEFTQAVRVLDSLNAHAAKYKGRPIRRLISKMGGLIFGSAARTARRAERELVKTARDLANRGDIDGANQARLLLTTAKHRGMQRSGRYKRAMRLANKRLSRAISKAISDGDAQGVENAHMLRMSYKLDRYGLKFDLPAKEYKRMQKDMLKADKKSITRLIDQAEWILGHPEPANRYQYNASTAAAAVAAARVIAERLTKDGQSIPWGSEKRLEKLSNKLNGISPSLLARLAHAPIALLKAPFKLGWAIIKSPVTLTKRVKYEWKALKAGGAIPPTDPNLFGKVVNRALGREAELSDPSQFQPGPASPYGNYM